MHLDYCYNGERESEYSYVLIVKNDFSSYIWLYSCTHTDAEYAADALVGCCAAFGVSKIWVSEQGSCFNNKLVRMLRERLRLYITLRIYVGLWRMEL